ncbi:hypothetical protein CEXT_97831 [Caerostris extrusa]|uniref:Uncharacterized protein n=1 Tax=Caerostris extrusa TaxID=172846 RepID=A0AAV4XLW3_CAEEX|nr:hypothetical protein CEXT_97831 [Caerostris extrusa]
MLIPQTPRSNLVRFHPGVRTDPIPIHIQGFQRNAPASSLVGNINPPTQTAMEWSACALPSRILFLFPSLLPHASSLEGAPLLAHP